MVTGIADEPVRRNSAIAIEGGAIAAIGASEDILARYQGGERIDGHGLAVMPGLANCHNHLVRVLARGVFEDQPAPNTPPYSRRAKLPFPTLAASERRSMVRLGALEAIRGGTTVLMDIAGAIEDYAAVLAETGLRLVLAEQGTDRARGVRVGEAVAFARDLERGEGALQAMQALFDNWNGAMGGRIKVAAAVHAPDMASPEFLGDVRALQERLGCLATIHLNQYWGEVDAVKMTRGVPPTLYLRDTGFLSDRLVAAHCRCMTPKEEAALGTARATVCFTPVASARGGCLADIAALEHAGCEIVLGSDEFTEDMFEVMRMALLLERSRRGDGNSVMPHQVFRWATANGYRALGFPDGGTLREGGLADLVMMDVSGAHHAPGLRINASVVHSGQAGDIRNVMVDGNWIMRDGKVLTLDEDHVITEANEVARAAWARTLADNPSIPVPDGFCV
ncbi:MAG: amidohydrolase family protein [Alphaproteobacteria bacterium]